MKSSEEHKQKYLEYVMHMALKAWDGEVAEFRVVANRSGASVIAGTRKFFSESGVDNKQVR